VDFIKEIWLILVFALFLSLLAIKLLTAILSGYFIFLPEFTAIFSPDSLKLLGLLLFVLLTSGLVPAYYLTSRVQAKSIYKDIGVKRRRSGFMNYLIVIQFGLCTFLIISNLVIQRQLSFLNSFDPGYKEEELITIPLNMHIGEGIYNERLDIFCEETKNHPGVRDVTLGFSSPASVMTSRDAAEWEGKTEDKMGIAFCWNSVYFDYFETLGIKVTKGRSFSREFPRDVADYDKMTSNFVLNQAAVIVMGIEDPIGKAFSQYGFEGQIVGVVEDFHFRSLHEEILPMVFSMNPIYYNDIIVRIDPGDISALRHIKKVWSKFVPDKALEINFVTDQLNENYKSEQNLGRVLNIFFIVAMLIAIVGLITLTLSSTQQRIREIGIRKVNGASVVQILTMLNRDYLKWVALGFMAISPVVWLVIKRWLHGFAYKIALDMWMFMEVGLLIFALAVVTISCQSLSTVLTNPVKSLKYE
jgi:putative ABC transport system permease protein